MKIEKIEILNNKILQVLLKKEDGGNHRITYAPDTDISSIPYEEVKILAQKEWTDDIIESYKQELEQDYLK